MSREVRRVPENWRHPKDERGKDIPLGRSYQEDVTWYENYSKKRPDVLLDPDEGPGSPSEYMPDWSKEECTHYQMYETCSEGTPISPVMETPEELAQWLVDNDASAFGYMTASYEGWLNVCRGNSSVGMVVTQAGHYVSGVDAVVLLSDEQSPNQGGRKLNDNTEK